MNKDNSNSTASADQAQCDFRRAPRRRFGSLRPEDVTQGGRPKRRHYVPRSNFEIRQAASRLPEVPIREAVLRTLPKRASEFQRRLHLLARHLRQISKNETAQGWRHVLQVWYFLAQPAGNARWRWEKCVAAFEEIYATSSRTPSARLDRIAAASLDSTRSVYSRVTTALASIGRRIGQTFYASVRSIARWAGTSSATAGRILDQLIRSASVRVVEDAKPDPFKRDARTLDVGPLLALNHRTGYAVSPELEQLSFHPVKKPPRTPAAESKETTTSEKGYLLVSHDYDSLGNHSIEWPACPS